MCDQYSVSEHCTTFAAKKIKWCAQVVFVIKKMSVQKTDKSVGKGEIGLTLEFQNFIVQKDSWAYVDTNGIIFSEKELEF